MGTPPPAPIFTPAPGPANAFRPSTGPHLTRRREPPPRHVATPPGPPPGYPPDQLESCRPADHRPDPDPRRHQDPPTDAWTAPPQHLRPYRPTAEPDGRTRRLADLHRHRPTPTRLAAACSTLAAPSRRPLPPTSARLATCALRRPPRPATADLEPTGDLRTAGSDRPCQGLDRCDGPPATLATSATGRVDTPDRRSARPPPPRLEP